MLALGAALLCGRAGLANDIQTDANILTGLDISYSVDADDMRLEIEGLARAIRSPEVLAAIQSGRNGRIGFAVFAWHHDHFPVVVPWTLIASEEDALTVARAIEARLRVDIEAEARIATLQGSTSYYIGRLTDLSEALDHAMEMLQAAPFAATRTIVNVIGNGEDNVGEDAAFARDRIVEAGAIVNGVVLGDEPSVLDYYRQQVIGGAGAFVMSTGEADTLVEAMTRKFRFDIALAVPPAPAAGAVVDW
jgi:hypothetical protein